MMMKMVVTTVTVVSMVRFVEKTVTIAMMMVMVMVMAMAMVTDRLTHSMVAFFRVGSDDVIMVMVQVAQRHDRVSFQGIGEQKEGEKSR
jgi:hypothetical protein